MTVSYGGKSGGKGELPCAIIIGLGSLQGLKAARILAGHGVPVVAIADNPAHYCCRTNACRQIYSADTTSDAFVELLLRLAPEFVGKPVLFPCQDGIVKQLARHREVLSPHYRFSLPDDRALELLTDKSLFYAYAGGLGFRTPANLVINSDGEFADALRAVRYPCVVKPAYRTRDWDRETKFKAFKPVSEEELVGIYRKFKALAIPIVIQEWIPGGDDRLFSCNCYFNGAHEPLVTFVARKIRQWPPEIGESSSGIECRNDLVLGETLRLFKTAGLVGLGYLEMKENEETGAYYLIEANIGRPTGRSAIAEAGGVNLLYTMYCDLAGLPLPESRVQCYGNVKWIHLTRDLASAYYYWRKGRLSVPEWLGSLRGKKTFAVLSWSDPRPFLADVAGAVGKFKNLKQIDAPERMTSTP